jgi:hypothetical protein
VPVGTIFEVFYTFGLLDLQILERWNHLEAAGRQLPALARTLPSSSAPDVQAELPNSSGSPKESQVQAELIVAGQVYRVTNIARMIHHLTTAVGNLSCCFRESSYFLASGA